MKIQNNILGISGIIVLICATISSAGVALDEKFDTDLSKWKILDEPNHPELGQVVNVKLTGGGSLQVDMTLNDRFRNQGLQSIERYPLPAGGKLVVDFYGTNHSVYLNSSHTMPFWTVASYQSTGFFDTDPNMVVPDGNDWFAVKGWDAYWGDWVMWNGMPGVYQNIEVPNPEPPPALPAYISLTNNQFKHVIFEIDASFIRVYIEDDFYENLSGPTALYSVAASDVFTTAELTNGLYVYVLAARYTEWFTGQCGELFDGVKVTRIGATVPMNCSEAMDMGYGADGADADINKDCHHDFYDFASIAQDWLKCVDPANANCAKPWLQ
jgi:hypothetical protein